MSHPACVSAAVAVGSVAVTGGREVISSFSNNHPTMVDLLAPGEDIEAPVPGGWAVEEDGTSMAAPHVAGAWALVREHRPEASVGQVLARLRQAGVDVLDDRRVGAGAFSVPRLRLDPGQLGLFGGIAPKPCTRPAFRDVAAEHVFCPQVAWLTDARITRGFPDGTFGPARRVTRQAIAAFLHRQAGTPDVEYRAEFADIGPDHRFAEAISWMATEGLADGYDDATFRPEAPVSRQGVAAFLYRAAGRPEVDTTTNFVDVGADHPFAAAIAWMAAEGITQGYATDDGQRAFRPGSDLRRQAVAAFLFVREFGPER